MFHKGQHLLGHQIPDQRFGRALSYSLMLVQSLFVSHLTIVIVDCKKLMNHIGSVSRFVNYTKKKGIASVSGKLCHITNTDRMAFPLTTNFSTAKDELKYTDLAPSPPRIGVL